MRQYSSKGFSRPGHMKDVLVTLLKRGGATITTIGLLTVGALIAGCGSGGGSGDGAGSSSQVSGVAATGSPLAGQVTLKDSSSVRNEKGTDIKDDGSFAIDVAGMTPPFILKATGTSDGVDRTMFSFAEKAGTANINPLSNAAVANAAGVEDPAELFDKSDSATLDKIKTAMPTSMPVAVKNLQAKLKTLLVAFAADSTDPVTGPFKADHDGLDDLFDNVKIVLANGILTITNADTGAVLFTAKVTDLAGNFTDKDEDVPKHGPPRPAAPTNVTAVGGPGPDQVTVSWDPVANATSYDLFFMAVKSTSKSEAADEEDRDGEDSKQRIKNILTTSQVVSGLDPTTTYTFIVRARINGRKGARSAPVSASPSGTTTTTIAGTTTSTTAGATTSTTAGATTSTTAGATTSTTAGATTTTIIVPTTTTTTAPTTTTTTTTASTTTTTLAAPNGVALYNANCSNCHGPLGASEHQGASAAQITAGINGVASMRNSILATNGGALTAAQIAAISVALQ